MVPELYAEYGFINLQLQFKFLSQVLSFELSWNTSEEADH